MIAAFLTGYGTSLGLILAIGAQNAFVLRQGLRREYVLPVVLICALSDAVLILAGVMGFGALVQSLPGLRTVMTLGGAAVLLLYGFYNLRSALRGSSGLTAGGSDVPSLRRVVLLTLAFTWANPHVYLDTLVLVGSISTSFLGAEKGAFALGAVLASFCFFFALGFGARFLAPLLARPQAWRWLDGGIAVVMFTIAATLLMSLR